MCTTYLYQIKAFRRTVSFHYFWHCKESESEKGSSKSTFRALETASFAMEGRDKREQWILFARSRRSAGSGTAEKRLKTNGEETDTLLKHRVEQARVTTGRLSKLAPAVNKFFTVNGDRSPLHGG